MVSLSIQQSRENTNKNIEENARAQLRREELIEEIEQKVGGLRELEEAGRK
ncbi:hypothetical protein SLEP1_g29340 [Rubroshorea leprosula]|uniref:Uncharacterized protein n=1 Tax=Rubroshorea leprosula TaxID=152421 RepID=A0AAV5K2A9_9ROSI|nr:hypothetical protein SLEP1_g29340 [Rubroshorea leprosula]